MLKFKSRLTAAAVLALICLANAPARAATAVTYVSGKGKDSGNCSSPASPCRTFQFAVNQTAAGGEVKALDPADYSPVTINKSISITGVDGAGIDTNGGSAITLNASAKINLANLVIQDVTGSGIGIGEGAGAGPSLTITHCTVRGFSTGIFLSNVTRFLIADTVVTNNNFGILASFSNGTLDHVVASQNSNGVTIAGSIITAVDTIASNNVGNGFDVNRGTFLLAHSTATGNGTGVNVDPSFSSATSFGDNHIRGNTTDVKGTLIKVGTQ